MIVKMLATTLITLFKRDLNRLKTEIESYQEPANLWITEKAIANSAGNLCLHLIGNLNTYIGANLGQSGYIRNRELEFSLKDVPVKELVKNIVDTISVIESALTGMSSAQMEAEYPFLVMEEKTTTQFFLIHLSSHLNYHLGQINYHRRLLDHNDNI